MCNMIIAIFSQNCQATVHQLVPFHPFLHKGVAILFRLVWQN